LCALATQQGTARARVTGERIEMGRRAVQCWQCAKNREEPTARNFWQCAPALKNSKADGVDRHPQATRYPAHLSEAR